MKVTIKTQLVALLGLCAYASQALADDDQGKKDEHGHEHHDHAEKLVAGPNGGRVLTSIDPHLEFFVNEDRTVRITALDKDLKPAKIGRQSVKIVAGDRRSPTKLSFEKKDGVLVSSGKLPEGNHFPLVIQIKSSKLGKRKLEKFNLNLSDCPSCDYKEYACTCDHGHSHGDHDHDHDKDSS